MCYAIIREETAAFARRVTGLGFRVYVAKAGTYGFITDDTESRVLSFSIADDSLSGNYGPPSIQSGTGWGMDKHPSSLTTAEEVREALYVNPPEWTLRKGKGWRYLSTVAQYLSQYGSSSQFKQFDENA